jgi:hypothetical protein
MSSVFSGADIAKDSLLLDIESGIMGYDTAPQTPTTTFVVVVVEDQDQDVSLHQAVTFRRKNISPHCYPPFSSLNWISVRVAA